MPYSNIVGATPNSLAGIAAYLVDTGHSHHEDYALTQLNLFGASTVQDFIDCSSERFEASRRKKRRGRPPRNAANWVIVRTPQEVFLQPHEMAAYERTAIEAVGMHTPIVGILNWHINEYTGASDMNLLVAAFTEDGSLIRDRHSHPVWALRWRIDQVTEELNKLRLEKGIPPIPTMKEIQSERAKQRGEIDLVEELARLPSILNRTQDLKPALLSLGCEVTRFNPVKDSLSVIPKGKKKAKKFSISLLLEAVMAMREQQQEKKKSEENSEIGVAKVPTKTSPKNEGHIQ